MPELTSTVKLDQNTDFVYESAITGDVLKAEIFREADARAKPGTCKLTLADDDGAYTPKGGGATPLRPLDGVQVVSEGVDQFTGFVRKVRLDPSGKKQKVIAECADWLYILSRTDISRPLMRDVKSGTLINRLVDAAEVGEHVDNPRFRDDLTGYSAVGGGASITRKTDAPIMEGAAAMQVVTAADTEGGRYAIPHDADGDFQSTTVKVVVYVINDGGTAGDFIVIVADSGGNRGASAATALTENVQRLEATGTFDGAATDFYIDIEQSGAGARTFRVLAVHCTFSKNAIPRAVDDGIALYAYVAPRRVNALRAIQEAATNDPTGLIFVDGSGTFTYHDGHHRWRESECTSSQGTIDEAMTALPYEEDAEDLIGKVEFTYAEWVEGEAGTQVWSADRLPLSIPANDSITVEIDFGAIVRDVIVPVANTDYEINRDSTGGGSDESGNVTLAFDDFGGGAQVVFTSSVAYPVYLTKLVIRGTPVRLASDTPQVEYEPSGAPVVASKLRYNFKLLSQRRKVETWAQYYGDRYVTQRETLPVALINKSAGMVTQQTTREMSERVTIVNDNKDYSAKINGPYYIDAIRHVLDEGATRMRTVWGVSPVDVDMGIWDSSTWGGGDVWAP